MSAFRISHKELSDFLISSPQKDVEVLLEYIKSLHDISEALLIPLKYKLNLFIPTFQKKWKNALYNVDKFNSKNEQWLISELTVKIDQLLPGRRPSTDYDSTSKSTKRRKLLRVNETFSDIEIQESFLRRLKASGKINLWSKIKDLLSDKVDVENDVVIEKNTARLSDDEALALIEDAKLSKYQYEIIREKAKAINSDIYPSYKSLEEARKRCYPSQSAFTVSEDGVSVNLQDLMDHTASRIVQIPHISASLGQIEAQNISIFLISKFGGDGTSGHNLYNQSFTDSRHSDKSIFMFSMVPLALQIDNDEASDTIWYNPHPGSTRLCRLIKFIYKSETKEITKSEISDILKDVDCLRPSVVYINEGRTRCEIVHKMSMTMLDGKICQALTDTSSSSCYICKATPLLMNNLEKLKELTVDENMFHYGLATLHAWIRFMEAILHIAYRLSFRKWAVRLEEEKKSMRVAKERIQKAFKDELGLLIDMPKQGAGNSNSGNTARRFFANEELSARITGVDLNLIKSFHVILQVIACGRRINVEKFHEFCKRTAELYIDLYPWYYMPVTVHKVLIHGSKIIEKAILPIGQLTEEAQEARNKDLKRFREFNTRKCSRLSTNVDLGRKLLLSSDPVVNTFRKVWSKVASNLHPDAEELLADCE